MHIDKLDEIVNKYNNKCHSTIKMKLINVKENTHIYLDKKITKKILNLELVITLEYQSTKTFLQKAVFQIGMMKFL